MGSLGRENRTVVCTIVAKNYLHFARTLMESVRGAHPDWHQVVLLADERSYEQPTREPFDLVDLSSLPLPDRRRFCYRYKLLELSTAVKPWFLEWLFRKEGVDRVIYLDPDIYVYQPLREVQQILSDGALMVLTPHLTQELDDNKRPNEQDILRAGTYNLGFLALGRHTSLPRFLSWWQRKLEFDCRVSLAEALFVDQRWMDLAPGLFPDVHILRHEGYNVAYWNLKHRRIAHTNGKWQVNSQPLVFFHYSGIDPLAPTAISRHQDRLYLRDLGAGRRLMDDYCQAVLSNGLEDCRRLPYAFARLHDGTQIIDAMRHLYRRDPRAQELAGDDPFAHDHAYLNEPWQKGHGVLVTGLMRQLWEDCPDVRETFPDLKGKDRAAFADWFVNFGRREGLPKRFTSAVAQSLQEHPAALGGRLPAMLVRRTLLPLLRLALVALPLPVHRETLSRKYGLLRSWARWLPGSIRRALKVEIRQLLEWRQKLGPGWPLLTQLWALGRSLLNWSFHLANGVAPRVERPVRSAVGGSRLAIYSPNSAAADGLNIIGYVRSEHGIGESVRLCAQAAEAAGLPFSLHDVTAGPDNRARDSTWVHRISQKNTHPVNLLHINADALPAARAALGTDFFAEKYNIGFWHWEMPKFPASMVPSFDLLDEVWVPSRFVRDALLPCSSRPVHVVPHALRCVARPNASRATLGLPQDRFLFLVMYDLNSVTERKNPDAAIEAFCKAFPHTAEAALVVKVNNGRNSPQDVARLRQLLGTRPDVAVIDRILARQEVYDLIGLCDGYVSLHRSEGFGLGLAEAMCLGKPVVATNWSGNLEFMTEENSCLVDYHLTCLDRDYGPYARGQMWAEPDVDHAAWHMRKLVDEPAWAVALAVRGQHTIWQDFSPEAIGRLYRERLKRIEASPPRQTSARRRAA